MYGIINQAVKDLVTRQFGEESWQRICTSANSPQDFIPMEYYPDKLTYDLVGVASKELGMDPHSILAAFGKYWILYTAQEGYGPIMDLFGKDFYSCLKNLNNLHDRMGMTMPHLKPPKFEFVDVDSKNFLLIYESQRKGLENMVSGLIEGLAEKYNVKAGIKIVSTDDKTKTTFQVTMLE